MSTQHVYRLQLVATRGEQEGELDCVLLLELPPEAFDPLDYLAFLQAGRDKTTALFEEEMDKTAATYADLQSITPEEARIELSGIICEQAGLALEAGADEKPRIIVAS